MKQLYIELTGVLDNKIQAIKGIRAITGGGLRESKDLIDELITNGGSRVLSVSCDSYSHSTGMDYLRQSGLHISEVDPKSEVRLNLAEQIRGAVTFASLTGQYDISHALIDFLQNYFPDGTDAKDEE